ncbi:hypothetical protein SEVIR_4G094500v4 [Setaria viridis]|uniref:Uncharacterized protein n=1 Tax=Setaria viridis TaxID=4556 RepID=A0A4U6UV29_SETVI|nr:transcription termination factor MTEF1, chloroplastic-like [Setaria viridis]TKW20521.1 hypothetical protein SEVIR_4G094500v2 [Setaria viridis]
MLHLRDRILPLLRAASTIHPRPCLLLSTSTSTSPAPFSLELEDYLVAACGLTPAQARKASQQAFDEAAKRSRKPIEEFSYPRLNSASKNPDAILALLSGVGLSRADIAAVVAADPLLLHSSVKTVGPRLLALRDRLGLSPPQIVRFLLVGSDALCHDVIPKLQFLISFYGSFEQVLVVVKRSNSLLRVGLESVIKPNIALFRQIGVQDIVQLCSNTPRLLTFNLERLKDCLLRAEELGVPRTSRMFKYAVSLVAGNSKEKVAAKLEFFKRTLGCSEAEVSIAMSKVPTILGISDENLTRKIEFLVNEVGMEPQYILERPILLGYSLKKRLLPRHRVVKALQAKGLLNSNMNLFSLAVIGEEAFRLKFVDCHKDSVPGLAGYYATACDGDVPPEVQLLS